MEKQRSTLVKKLEDEVILSVPMLAVPSEEGIQLFRASRSFLYSGDAYGLHKRFGVYVSLFVHSFIHTSGITLSMAVTVVTQVHKNKQDCL